MKKNEQRFQRTVSCRFCSMLLLLFTYVNGHGTHVGNGGHEIRDDGSTVPTNEGFSVFHFLFPQPIQTEVGGSQFNF